MKKRNLTWVTLFQNRFVCRSVEYNIATLQCTLSEYDRRYPGAYVDFNDARGVDYFENLCNQGKEKVSVLSIYQILELISRR